MHHFLPHIIARRTPLLLSVQNVFLQKSDHYFLLRRQSLSFLGVEPLVGQPCATILRQLLTIVVPHFELRWILEPIAVRQSISFHILTAKHAFENLRVVVSELYLLLEIYGIVRLHSNEPKFFVFIA